LNRLYNQKDVKVQQSFPKPDEGANSYQNPFNHHVYICQCYGQPSPDISFFPFFNDFASKDGERSWSTGVSIIYDFRLLIAD